MSKKLSSCSNCGQFLAQKETHCPFCDESLEQESFQISSRASRLVKVGAFALTVSFFGVGGMLGCAYGAPPPCKSDQVCGTGNTCNVKTGQCEQKAKESSKSESAPDAGVKKD